MAKTQGTNQAKVVDSIVVEMNGEQVEAKGPAPDRLEAHSAEARAFDARLRKENGPKQ